MSDEISRREALFHIGARALDYGSRIATTAAPFFLANRESANRPTTYIPRASEGVFADLPEYPAAIAAARELEQIISGPATVALALRNIWEDEYYRSHVETKWVNVSKTRLVTRHRTVCDSKGNCRQESYQDTETYTEPELKQETVWEWEEPYELTGRGINHRTLESATDLLGRTVSKSIDLRASAGQAFDTSSGISFTPKQVDRSLQEGIATIMYLFGGAGLGWYDKISQLMDTYGSNWSRIGESKRALFRGLATLASSLLVTLMQDNSAANNSSLLEKSQAHARAVISKVNNWSDRDAFGTFFGMQPQDIIATLQNARQFSQTALDSGYRGWGASRWPQIADQFNQLEKASAFALGKIRPEISPELAKATRLLLATREIQSFSGREQITLEWEPVGRALAFGTANTVMATGYETIVAPKLEGV